MNRWSDAILAADLSELQLRIALYIGSAADYGTGRNFWRGVPTVAEAIGCSRRAVQYAIRHLVALGLLEHGGKYGERLDRQTNIYHCHPNRVQPSVRPVDANGAQPKVRPVKPAQNSNGVQELTTPRGAAALAPNLVPGPAPESKTNVEAAFTLSRDADVSLKERTEGRARGVVAARCSFADDLKKPDYLGALPARARVRV
jgi:hypothetical protein